MPGDPNAPKRNMSAYFLFSIDEQKKMKAENPSLHFTQCTKKCGELWKTVDEATKAKYEKKAAEDKERYTKEFAEYKKTDEYEDGLKMVKEGKKAKAEKKAKKKVKAGKQLKDLAQKFNKPKRPMNELFTFLDENRAKIKKEQPTATLGETTKIIMKMWESADAATKKRIAEKKAKQEEDYKVQMAAWEASEDYAQYTAEARKTRQDVKVKNAALSGATAKVGKVFTKDLKDLAAKYGKPKQPCTAYFLFTDEVREQIFAEVPGAKTSFGKVGQIATKMWEKIDKTVAMPRLEAKKSVLDYEYYKAMEAWEASEEGKKYAEEAATIKESQKEACANANKPPSKPGFSLKKRGRPSSKSNTVAEPPKKKRQIIDD